MNEREINQELKTETETGKCPACGAEMEFSPETQGLVCPYCGTEKEIVDVKITQEQDFDKLFDKPQEWGEETHVFRCDNCGAKEVVAKTEIAKKCPFCDTTNIVKIDELSGIKPTGVVPFAVSKKSAMNSVLQWAKKRFFAPKSFKESVQVDKINGTYNPAFTFDCTTHSNYSGVLGKYYTRTVRRNGKTVTVRELRYFSIAGNHDMMFDDVLVQASSKVSQNDIDKIMPFNTNESKEYTSEFLHGYLAQQYEKDGKECWSDAKIVIDKHVRARILSRYNYDVVSRLSVSTNYCTPKFKYLLLPLYVGNFRWKEKIYNFFINGFNGKVTGKTPISPLKVALTVLIGIMVVIGFFALAYFLE